MSNKIILRIIGVIFLISCGFSDIRLEAEELWSKYFKSIKSETYQEILQLYSEEFYKATPKEDWIKILKRTRDKLGGPESYQQVNWKVQAQAHRFQSGTIVTLIYDVQYSKHDAQETIVVFKPASGEDASIIAHNINSKDLLSQ